LAAAAELPIPKGFKKYQILKISETGCGKIRFPEGYGLGSA
jgi:hypothetical protein